MPDAFLERKFEPAITPDDVMAMAAEGADCFGLHGVAWHASLLAVDGRRMFCRFSSPDLESVRIALRQAGADARVLWPGTVLDAPDATQSDQRSVNVVVARRFDRPVSVDELQAAEDANAWCLEAHGVTFLRTCLSVDARRLICLYRAPDAESVRIVQREARLPFESVWSCTPIWP
ncbi:MAG TPA: nickel-binding protein [Woeseiaceae bacterium]|nr:nickel-binding protein [Woeseiaceae bacterium]